MITDEEFSIIARECFAKIRRIASSIVDANDVDVIRGVKEMNGILERIKEIRAIQREQRGEEDGD